MAAAIPVARPSRRKGEALLLPFDITRPIARHLHETEAGHFPIVTPTGAAIAIVVSLDRFNVFAYIAELLDDPEIAAAIDAIRSKKREQRGLSFEEVFGKR
jgi:hypothetical protein